MVEETRVFLRRALESLRNIPREEPYKKATGLVERMQGLVADIHHMEESRPRAPSLQTHVMREGRAGEGVVGTDEIHPCIAVKVFISVV